MTFHQMLTRLMELYPAWGRKMCVLAARIYLGIDDIRQYEGGHMVTMCGNALLSKSELRQVISAWWAEQRRTLQSACGFLANYGTEEPIILVG